MDVKFERLMSKESWVVENTHYTHGSVDWAETCFHVELVEEMGKDIGFAGKVRWGVHVITYYRGFPLNHFRNLLISGLKGLRG